MPRTELDQQSPQTIGWSDFPSVADYERVYGPPREPVYGPIDIRLKMPPTGVMATSPPQNK